MVFVKSVKVEIQMFDLLNTSHSATRQRKEHRYKDVYVNMSEMSTLRLEEQVCTMLLKAD